MTTFQVVLTVWGVLWALATCLQSAFPPASIAGRICHAVLAISPLDFVKALKALGGALVPPVAVLALLFLPSCTLFGSPAAPAPDPKAQQVAQAAVSTAAAAWVMAADVCLASAGVDGSSAANVPLAKACESVLMPVHDAIVEAQVAVSVWDAASRGNLPCLMHEIGAGLAQASALFRLPQAVSDAEIIVFQFGNACADGGAK